MTEVIPLNLEIKTNYNVTQNSHISVTLLRLKHLLVFTAIITFIQQIAYWHKLICIWALQFCWNSTLFYFIVEELAEPTLAWNGMGKCMPSLTEQVINWSIYFPELIPMFMFTYSLQAHKFHHNTGFVKDDGFRLLTWVIQSDCG